MLKLVATPIGNLGDITLRALESLREADVIFAEDTRRTLQLLNHFSIKKPLVSCHAHNEAARANELVALLEQGREVVFVSDAGTPGISDPGAALVQACVEHGLPFTVLPGASAVLAAAVLSGLPCTAFSFFGFLPRDGRARRDAIRAIGACGHLALLYESPHRVAGTLADLAAALGDLPAALLRELTKKFETAERGTLSRLPRNSGRKRRAASASSPCCAPGRRQPRRWRAQRSMKRFARCWRRACRCATRRRRRRRGRGRPKKEAYARALALKR